MTQSLSVVTALRLEQLAARRGLAGVPVLRCGMGAARLDSVAAALDSSAPSAVAVVGVGGAVMPGVLPGDVVLASEVCDDIGSVALPAAALLLAELQSLGLRVHYGPIRTTSSIVHGPVRAQIAASGVIAVDMESAKLARALATGPHHPALAVLRVVVDTPEHGLLRPSTLTAGSRALRTLSRIGPALRNWSSAMAGRTVLLASPRSFCAGVERAIDIVDRALDRYPGPVYVRRQIVHNRHVVAGLEQRGAVFVDELGQVPDRATVILSAHGVAPAVRDEAERRNMRLIDATCPLVAKVHAETRRYLGRGDTVILIGHDGHDETEGTLGEAPGDILLVPDVATAWTVEVADPARVSYVTQTTLATDEAQQVADVLRQRFPSIAEPPSDDICYATSNRQNAVRAIAAEADLVLVLGSENSSNSRRLVEVARRCGTDAQLIEDVRSIRPEWLAGVRTLGLTAGASAPPHLVAEVLETVSALGPIQVREVSVAREELTFTLPKEVDS